MRLRLTVRRLMVLVAFAAVALGALAWIEARRRRFEGLRMHFTRLEARGFAPIVPPPPPGQPDTYITPLGHHYHNLAVKYERAAERPWLPVEPDPPEPRPVEDVPGAPPTLEPPSPPGPRDGVTPTRIRIPPPVGAGQP